MVQLVSTSDFDSGDIGSNPVTPARLSQDRQPITWILVGKLPPAM